MAARTQGHSPPPLIFGVVALACLGLVGCEVGALRYSISAGNVAAARELAAPVNVGTVTAAPGVPGRGVSCGAMSVTPPDDATFAEYIGGALRADLGVAGMAANSGPMLRAQVDQVTLTASPGNSAGRWHLALTVSSQAASVSVEADHDFRAFAFNKTACELAALELPAAVQDLVGALLRSPDFRNL